MIARSYAVFFEGRFGQTFLDLRAITIDRVGIIGRGGAATHGELNIIQKNVVQIRAIVVTESNILRTRRQIYRTLDPYTLRFGAIGFRGKTESCSALIYSVRRFFENNREVSGVRARLGDHHRIVIPGKTVVDCIVVLYLRCACNIL